MAAQAALSLSPPLGPPLGPSPQEGAPVGEGVPVRREEAVAAEESRVPLRYYIQARIGHGTFGVVYSAQERSRTPPRDVAIKVFPVRDNGDDCDGLCGGASRDALYEASLMRALPPHANVVRLLDVVPTMHDRYGCGSTALVYERLPTDLFRYIGQCNGGNGSGPCGGIGGGVLLRSYAYQLLRALEHCHRHGVVHRDVKPSNVLIGDDGVLKLADFGCARLMVGDARLHARALSPNVCTLWYRAPELLQGATRYGAAVDVWSAACCIVEMITGQPLLRGDGDVDQLMRICRTFGAPPPLHVGATGGGNKGDVAAIDRDTATRSMLTSALMQSMLKTKFASAPSAEPFDVRRLPVCAADVLTPELLNDLLRSMFAVDPAQRASAARCLQHRYFDDVRQQFEAVLEARNDASPATVAFIPMSER